MARTLGFLVLALALGVGAASNFKPSVDFSLSKDLGSGLSVDSLKGAVSVESQLSEDVSVGAQLDRDAASGLKGLFAKLSHSMGGGRVNADLSVGLEDNAVRGELGYEEGDNKLVVRGVHLQIYPSPSGLLPSSPLGPCSVMGPLRAALP